MVRHGRLSKGCENCRKRKIKCDQARPVCNQCLKGGWKCPGYGDAVERMFQRQSPTDFRNFRDAVPRIATCEVLPRTPAQELHSDTDFIPEDSLAMTNTTAIATIDYSCHNILSSVSLSKRIIQSINSRAIDFFLATQIFHESGVTRGYYEYLPVLISHASIDKRLFLSLSAVSLAAYGYNFHHADVLIEARRHYGRALQFVNDALSSKTEVIQDSTIISILLLSTFENMTCENQKSLTNTEAHMLGVMTILSMRGRHQFVPRYRLQIFLHMCICLYLSSLLRSARVPKELSDLRSYAAEFIDTNDPAWKLSGIMAKLAKLRADVKSGIFGNHRSIMEYALDIDRELISLVEEMPDQWRFQKVSMKAKSSLVFDTYFHVYPDLWMASIWNNLRTCRVLLYAEICKQLKFDSLLPPPQLTNSLTYHSPTRIVQQMIDEICASIPQFGGYLSSLSTYVEQTVDPPNNVIPMSAAGYFLMWPIWSIGFAIESKAQRDWIVNRTRYIGRKTGIQQAFAIADILEKETERLPFDKGTTATLI